MVHINKGDSIECLKARVKFKKIIPSVPKCYPVLGNCLEYSCSRDGTVEIDRELDPKPTNEEERKQLFNQNSKLDLGEILNANKVHIKVKGFRRETLQKETYSSRHNSQTMTTNNYTYAEISYPFVHIQNAIENRIRNIE